jgi:hypothetical protein
MRYTDAEVAAATGAVETYRAGLDGEVGAALAVVGLSSERVAKEAEIRDDMIRVAHNAGASIRELAEVSGLGRKAVTDIVSHDIPPG